MTLLAEPRSTARGRGATSFRNSPLRGVPEMNPLMFRKRTYGSRQRVAVEQGGPVRARRAAAAVRVALFGGRGAVLHAKSP